MQERNLPIDFRHLETFYRVAALKSFSKAAEDLFITQSTASGHILSLEKSLDIRLFDRTGREVRLTKAGEIFWRYASHLLSSRRELINALSEFSRGIKGELLVGASTIPGEYILPRLMGDFKKEYPRFAISLKIADTSEIIQYVLDGAVEFGLTGANPRHKALRYEKYAEDEIIAVSPPDHFLARKKAHMDDLVKEFWIVREGGSGTRMSVEKALQKRGKTLKQFRIAIEMGSTSSVREGVKAGLGLAFISKKAVEEDLNRGTLCRLEVEGLDPVLRQIYIASHRGRSLSPMGLAFLRFLRRNRKE